jgi:hypothetical protein
MRTVRLATIVAAAPAALALGATAAGCLWEDREEQLSGRICAIPNTGVVEHCVDASEGPASAWSKAEADGELPIFMWAWWSGRVTPEELIASEAELRAWFDTIDRVVSYVRDERSTPSRSGRRCTASSAICSG